MCNLTKNDVIQLLKDLNSEELIGRFEYNSLNEKLIKRSVENFKVKLIFSLFVK